MFESYEEAERSRGLKGFLARHFGPVVYLDITEKAIRQIGIDFMVLSILVGIFSMTRTGSALSLVDAFILAFLGLMLYLTKSRTVAIFLMAYSLLGALFAFPAVLPWFWVLFSARAIQLTFGYRRLMKLRSAALTAME